MSVVRLNGNVKGKVSEKRSGLPVGFHCTMEHLLKDHLKIQLNPVLKEG